MEQQKGVTAKVVEAVVVALGVAAEVAPA